MTAYVDRARLHPWRGRMVEWCHLIADSLDELHAFAESIGCKREWFQGTDRATTPHYDLQRRLRAKAIAAGAVELERRAFVEKARELRAQIGATVIDAARAIGADLMDVTGVTAVAVRQNRVLVYVTHARVGAKIPKVKLGVEVRVIPSGTVRPAPSDT